MPDQKHAGEYQRDQRRTKAQFRVIYFSAANYLGILKVDHFIPKMNLGNPPDANKEGKCDQQKEQEGFEPLLAIQEELRNSSLDRNQQESASNQLNNTRQTERVHLHTVEVASSNLAVPTITCLEPIYSSAT